MRVCLKLAALSVLVVVMQWIPAESAPDRWRVVLTSDNGVGMYGTQLFLGVEPIASNGWDLRDYEANYSSDISGTTRWMASSIIGNDRTFMCNTYAPCPLSIDNISSRAWPVYIAGLPRANNDPIRIRVSTSLMDIACPPSMFGDNPVGYRLVMEDNRGVAGAPANGTVWDLPIATTGASYYLPAMPIIKLSAGTDQAMVTEGYRMRFEQYLIPQQRPAVPEPGSLSVLAFGIAGLASSAFRRFRR